MSDAPRVSWWVWAIQLVPIFVWLLKPWSWVNPCMITFHVGLGGWLWFFTAREYRRRAVREVRAKMNLEAPNAWMKFPGADDE